MDRGWDNDCCHLASSDVSLVEIVAKSSYSIALSTNFALFFISYNKSTFSQPVEME